MAFESVMDLIDGDRRRDKQGVMTAATPPQPKQDPGDARLGYGATRRLVIRGSS